MGLFLSFRYLYISMIATLIFVPLTCYWNYQNVLDTIITISQGKFFVFIFSIVIGKIITFLFSTIFNLLFGCKIDPHDVSEQIVGEFFIFLFVRQNGNLISDVFLHFLPLLFLYRVFHSLSQHINKLSERAVPPSIFTQTRIILSLITFSGLIFYLICKLLLQKLDNAPLTLTILHNLMILLWDSLFQLLSYIWPYLFSSSYVPKMPKATLRTIFLIILPFFSLVYPIHLMMFHYLKFSISLLFYTIARLLDFGSCVSDYFDYCKTKQFQANLEDPTKEDLNNNDMCVICRQRMFIGTCKKLPCSHCFHTTCLEDWFEKSVKCPYCNREFKNIILFPEEEENSEWIEVHENGEQNEVHENSEQNEVHENTEQNEAHENAEQNEVHENEEGEESGHIQDEAFIEAQNTEIEEPSQIPNSFGERQNEEPLHIQNAENDENEQALHTLSEEFVESQNEENENDELPQT